MPVINDTVIGKLNPITKIADELKTRHIGRLQDGTCEFQQGFAFNDLLTNLERIAAHCSNVAVAMIETDSDEFDTHEYLKSVRHMKDAAYLKCFDNYAQKYKLAALSSQ